MVDDLTEEDWRTIRLCIKLGLNLKSVFLELAEQDIEGIEGHRQDLEKIRALAAKFDIT